MDYLAALFFSFPLFLLFWAKNKTEIKISRVFLLSYLPVFIISVIFYISSFVNTGKPVNSINIFILVNIFGYTVYFPILLTSALLVKVLQIKNFSTIFSAIFGSIFAVFLMFIFIGANKANDIWFYFIVFSCGFISVLLERKIFKGKQ